MALTANDVSTYMPKRLPPSFLSEILRGPKVAEKPVRELPPFATTDLDGYLEKIEAASQKLIQQSRRQHELEEKTLELMQREMQLLQQVDLANGNVARLEMELETERARATKAEEIARAIYDQLGAKVRELDGVEKKFTILTDAVDNAFPELNHT